MHNLEMLYKKLLSQSMFLHIAIAIQDGVNLKNEPDQ